MHEEQHHAGARDGVGQGVEQGGGKKPCQAGQQGQVRGGLDVPSQVDAALPQRPLKQLDLFNSKDSELIRTKEDDSKMEVSLDTAQYRPDELKIPVDKGVVCVEGRHEEKAEDGSKMVSRSFSRKYTLPKDAKPEDVVSNLSSDGVL